MTEAEARAALVAEVRTWVGTPYHHRARVKGRRGGVDCAQLILRAHVDAGLAEEFDPGFYTNDWHMHRSEEVYLSYVEQYLRRVDSTDESIQERLRTDPEWVCQPGDVLVWRHGRTFSHGAIVTEWPSVVHASAPDECVLEVSVVHSLMWRKPARVYSMWGAA